MRGYVIPDFSGNFLFSIAADGSGEFWLSSDADPAHKQLVCRCPGYTGDFRKYPQQTSKPVALVAGHKYYIEALQQGGGGNGRCEVAWELPDLGLVKIISGNFLSSLEEK